MTGDDHRNMTKMQTSGQESTLTLGGYSVVILAGMGVFALCYLRLGFYLESAIAFGAAGGLFVLWLLLVAMQRVDAAAASATRVRRIVPKPEMAVPMARDEAPVRPARPAPVQPAAPAAEVVPVAAVAPMAEPVAVAPVVPTPAAGPAAEPVAAATVAAGPLRLAAPRDGKADDLKEIEGIGPALERQLNALGFYHFDQIAAWTEADVALVDAEFSKFKGRITRDKWVAQAAIIVTEGLDAFRERARANNY